MASLPECTALLLRREESRVYVTINRPEVKNALNKDVTEGLGAVAEYVEKDPTVRAVIVRGSEGTFCAGGDIKGFKKSFETPPPEDGADDSIAKGNRSFGDFLIRFNHLPATTIGVIEGAAFGGGRRNEGRKGGRYDVRIDSGADRSFLGKRLRHRRGRRHAGAARGPASRAHI